MNTHIYELKHVRSLYRWIVKGKFIDFSTEFVFRHTPNENARKALDGFFEKFDWAKNDEVAIQEITAFVELYNKDRTKALQINDMIWSDFVKRYFQNGKIIDVEESVKVYVAHNIFLRQIKSMIETINAIPLLAGGEPAYLLNEEPYQYVLPRFLSQLYHEGFHDSVAAIHNYLYFTVQILQAYKAEPKLLPIESIEKEKGPLKDVPKSNEMDAKAVAVVMAPGLLDALELNGNINGSGIPDGDAAEVKFLARMVEIFLKKPEEMFKQPYSSKTYHDREFYPELRQLDFQSELEAYKAIQRHIRLKNKPFVIQRQQTCESIDVTRQMQQLSLAPPVPPPLSLPIEQPPATMEKSRSGGLGGFLSRIGSKDRDKEKEESLKKSSPKDENKSTLSGRSTSPKDKGHLISPKVPERQVSFSGRSTSAPRVASTTISPRMLEEEFRGFYPGYRIVALMPIADAQQNKSANVVPSTSVDLVSSRRSTDGAPDRRAGLDEKSVAKP